MAEIISNAGYVCARTSGGFQRLAAGLLAGPRPAVVALLTRL